MNPYLHYCFHPDTYFTTATVFPMTRPGQFDNEPWKKSMLAHLENELDLTSYTVELAKERLKRLQESDADPEEIDIVQDTLQSRLADMETIKVKIELQKKYKAEIELQNKHIAAKEAEIELQSLKAEIELESLKAEIELENKDIAEDQKHTTKVSKQQVKRPRQIDKPGKQTSEVPKQQEKKVRLIVNHTEVPMQ